MKKNDLREQIKSQIQNEISNKLSTDSSDSLENQFELEAERKRIFLEERDAFYQKQKGFIKIINEIGEEEWIRKEDLKKREGYFNFEDDLEDADSHKSKVIRNLIIYSGILLLVVCCSVYYFIEATGYVEVSCNIKGIPIFLDGQPTGLVTDNVIENVKAGKHIISLQGAGVNVDPKSVEVEVKHQSGANASFSADSINTKSDVPAIVPSVADSTAKQLVPQVKSK